eukprot:TRINITY_DN6023_c0_g3_i2.p1 TRINITY_DN6023_c0_g3~~TRINITY_DN6023_c0_g3_i2.p1  ORF type:complete len:488 (+),score=127.94 TRINITY_DN6023_c0_g3_i2:41-1504(+)
MSPPNRFNKTAFYLLVLSVLLSYANAEFAKQYQNCAILSEANRFRIHWNISGSRIFIGVEAPSPNGWAATGLSDDGTMDSGGGGKFSDGWVFGVNPGDNKGCANGCVGDIILTRHARPDWDDTQSVSNIQVTRNSSHSFAEFSRALTTGDSQDKPITPGTIQHVLWAFNPNLALKFGQIPDQHIANGMGAVSIDFGTNSSCNPPPPGGNEYSAIGGAWKASWKISDDKKNIEFTVTAKTNGWVGLGISDTAGMVGADVYVGWVDDASSTAYLYDSYASEKAQPQPDANIGGTNDVVSFKGTQSGGSTTIIFTRPLVSADSKDTSITDKRQYLLYAFGTADGTSGASPTFSKHTANGLIPMNFLSGPSNSSGDGSSAVAGGIDPTQFSFSNPVMKLTWQIEGEFIHFKMVGTSTGWIAFGLNSEPKMTGGDIYVGWVDDSTNAVTIMDTKATDKAMPTADTEQGGNSDVLLTSGKQEAGVPFPLHDGR